MRVQPNSLRKSTQIVKQPPNLAPPFCLSPTIFASETLYTLGRSNHCIALSKPFGGLLWPLEHNTNFMPSVNKAHGDCDLGPVPLPHQNTWSSLAPDFHGACSHHAGLCSDDICLETPLWTTSFPSLFSISLFPLYLLHNPYHHQKPYYYLAASSAWSAMRVRTLSYSSIELRIVPGT